MYSRKRTIEPKSKQNGKELIAISQNYKSNIIASRNRNGSKSRGSKGLVQSFKDSGDQALNSIQLAKNTITSTRKGMSKSTLKQKTIAQLENTTGRLKNSMSRERGKI